MEEITISLHNHTIYSDGKGTHQRLAYAAMSAGLDAVIVTDHNVLVRDFQKYWYADGKKVLMLIGEEVHDQARQPQANHLLVFNASEELAQYASSPQGLINQTQKTGGLSFIAHLYDPACPSINEGDISWYDWSVRGFTGIELWNSLSDLKVNSKNYAEVFFHVFFPKSLYKTASKEILKKWDELLSRGERIVAVGGADAHEFHAKAGPLRKKVFPYEFHFQTITTHILLEKPLKELVVEDNQAIMDALSKGHCYVALDLFKKASGFRFTCEGNDCQGMMGDEVIANGTFTFKISLPEISECVLLRDGKPISTWKNKQNIIFHSKEKGVYRVEVYKKSGLGRKIAWIYSNPIYVRG